ncbi:MAG: Hpt domain-containing protein, partial [Acetobacteraceae bacterium]
SAEPMGPDAAWPPPPDATIDGPIPEPDIPVVDTLALADLSVAIGEAGVRDMLGVFESETLSRLNRLSDATRDKAADQREIHTLKGAAGTVCARRLSTMAQTLEAHLREGGTLETTDVIALRQAFEAWRREARHRQREVARAA